ncbi:glycoside hydrolase family 13 protein [Dentipellis sp. KUC8613]|nr:glycoside hydrolase family 13 protein [Dentipellis sp. KUC8613]
MLLRSSLLAAGLYAAAPALAASADDWRSRAIYQLITDRFATSNDSNSPCDTTERRYCGGSWQGVINHLDYIQNMGFDAVWISPVSANIEGNTTAGEAFHGYWYQDITTLNPHFGTPDDLKELSKALHKRGMYLMLDVVVNHMAAPKMPPDFNFKDFFHPFTDESYFHQPPCFANDNTTDPSVLEQCWLGDTNLPLPDLNTENQTVVDLLQKSIHDIVQTYQVDGLRVDTVKHIRKDFWPGWASAAGVFTMGEVIANDTSFAAPYTQVLDAILDYPSYFPMVSAFSSPQGQFGPFISQITASQKAYKNGLFLTGSFFENHDQPRFQSYTKDIALVRNGMTFPFIHDGIPICYYGQEQGYQGASDPFNREALWLSAYQQEKPLVGHFKTLNAARKAAIKSSNGQFLHTPMKFYAIEQNSFAVSKPPMLALLTNIGSETSKSVVWNVPQAGFQPNEELLDVFTCSKVMADGQGGVNVRSEYGMPQMLMPANAVQGGDLCPADPKRRVANMAGNREKMLSGAVLFGSVLFFFFRFWQL